VIYELTPPDDVQTFREESQMANGLASDSDGLLLAAEHESRRVSRTLEDGTIVTVASEYMGDSLNSPNDIAVRIDGTIYFTDPPYGINQATQQELDFNGVFRVDPEGVLTAEWEGELESRPNGLVLSPDERRLYVADTTEGVMVFDVNADGSLGEEQAFVPSVAGADGMAMDTGGNLFVSTATGVQVFDPEGTLWGTIEMPEGALAPANCAFGGDDARTLYITARSALYQVRLMRPGLY
jgi:gluconolactonase